jgi:hypothetical protein
MMTQISGYVRRVGLGAECNPSLVTLWLELTEV